MSNQQPSPYTMQGSSAESITSGPKIQSHLSYNQVPISHVPPGYIGNQDLNSNSQSSTQKGFVGQVQNVNIHNQSGSNSPAFNQSGIVQTTQQSSPMRHSIKSNTPISNPYMLSANSFSSNASTSNVPSSNVNSYQSQQVNHSAPPLTPSSQYTASMANGPPMLNPSQISHPLLNYASTASNNLSTHNVSLRSTSSVPGNHTNLQGLPNSVQPVGLNQQVGIAQFSKPPGLPQNNPSVLGVPSSVQVSGTSYGLNGPAQRPPSTTGSLDFHSSGTLPSSTLSTSTTEPSKELGLSASVPEQDLPKVLMSRPPTSPFIYGSQNLSGLPSGNLLAGSQSLPPMRSQLISPNCSQIVTPQRSQMAPPQSLQMGPSQIQLASSQSLQTGTSQITQIGPPKASQAFIQNSQMGPPQSSQMGPPQSSQMDPPQSSQMGPPQSSQMSLPQSSRVGFPQNMQMVNPNSLQMGASQNVQMGLSQNLQPGPPSGPMSGPPSNMQSRYPQMPPPSSNPRQQPQQYTQYNNQHLMTQQVTQQMGQLSVTKQGFDQLWGHQMVDLMQCKHILPEYPEDPPEIRLGQQFADSPNCSPEVFRCTVNKIPDTNSLLQKSRLPLGILIHPFKDLNHLPVVHCATIVRCRACRTYINPFVYFLDSKRWKCNLCYRVNDLPEEFQYDPVTKSYGDPSRRPEIKAATIEFIAPGEYMLRPPQPAVYLFLMDVSQIGRESGYLQVLCDTLKKYLRELPGDARTQVGFICYDAHVHYYLMSEGLTRPKEMTVLDIDDVFLPSPESLLVNLSERMELVIELLTLLPQRHSGPGDPGSALGAALQAAYKLMARTGGRITVFQTCLPNVGPGALQSREDPNARSAKEVAHLNPATDFYKRLALDCSGAQISVDLFLLNSQYADLATLSGMSKFSAGTMYHIPLFQASKQHLADRLGRMLTRYLTRKIGFEAVMRVRCSRGIGIHTFHGNFFVRSTDLLSLPNVSPDAGFGMQLTIEENLSDLNQVCFQAALLYTSSKGERRIRVHTLALPVAANLSEVLHSADQQCIIGLLSKMAVDRCASASMSEAREALMNVAVDALSAFRLASQLPATTTTPTLHAPHALRLLPLYLSALLQRKAFRTGTSTRLDDRVADMCALKTQPLLALIRQTYPDLYAIHELRQYLPQAPEREEDDVPDPPRLQLSAERLNMNGAYLLDDGEQIIIYICNAVSPAFLSETFGVTAFSQLPDEAHSLPELKNEGNELLHAFIEKLNEERPYAADILVLRDNSPSRRLFTERLIEDRQESSFSYYEFLQHIKNQVK